jgi:hypothetical protein
MKIRKSFVTNSSSSSYVCDICGNAESGYDCSPRDFDMSSCIHGHIVCNSHIENKNIQNGKQELIDYLKSKILYHENRIETGDMKAHNKKWADNYSKALDRAINLEEDSYDLEQMLEDYDLNTNITEDDCPLCNLTDVSHEDMSKYLIKQYGLERKALLKEIKKNFNTYTCFSSYLRGK